MTEGDEVEYRTLEEFPGYRFGSDGTVWTCKRQCRWGGVAPWKKRALKVNPISGYQEIILQDEECIGRSRSVHSLICTAFHGPCPVGLECCHWDGSRTNNRANNLRWDTRKANRSDSRRLGRIASGDTHGHAKLSAEDIPEIQELVRQGWIHKRVAARFGVSRAAIGDIVNGRRWGHLTRGQGQ